MPSTDVSMHNKKLLRALCCTVSLACLAGSQLVYADSGAVGALNSQSPEAAGIPNDAAEPRVMVRGVEFSGNRTFASDQLAAHLADDLGKPMTFAELQALARKIEKHYHEAGYLLAKVVIPEQQFGEGAALKMVVLEGRLGSVDVQNNERFSDEQVKAAIKAAGIESGNAFTLTDLERALTRLNRLSGIEASSTLKPGQEVGSTDVVVDVKEDERIKGSLEVNNYGSENSGEYRVIPSVTLPNLTGRGDVLNAIAMASIGSGDVKYGYLDYKSPLNTIGTSAQIYVSKGNVGIGREFRVLEIEGDSTGWGLGVSQDYILSAQSILGASVWLESQDLEQTMLGTVTAEDKTRKLRLGVNWDNTDLSGRTLVSFDLHQGLGETLGGMENDSQLSSRSFAEADNSFTKLTYDITRLHRITPRLLLIPRFYGQYAFDSLVSGEQWAIGGVNSVMGHPSSAYSGDSGFTASVEGRYAILADDDRYQFIARLDHGQVFIKKPLIDQDDQQDLSGVGLGVQAHPVSNVELRLDWGLPVGGKTEDSSYVYAQARYRF